MNINKGFNRLIVSILKQQYAVILFLNPTDTSNYRMPVI